MKKTPDLSAIMADYTAQVRAEEKRRQAIRNAAAAGTQEWFAKWGRSSSWNISDRD